MAEGHGGRRVGRELIAEAEAYVARMPPTPGQRELRARLGQYRRVVQSWGIHPPTDEQRRAMRDQIGEVLHIARGTAPTRKVRRPPE